MNKKLILWTVIVMLMVNNVNAFNFKFEILGYTIAYNPSPEQQVINKVEPQQANYIQSQQSPYITQTNQENAKIPMTQKNVYQTYSIPSNTPTQTHQFDEEINFLNSVKEVQLILKELDYQNIGVIDTDTGKYYTAIVNNDGIITSVYNGDVSPEIEIRGSFSRIRAFVEQNNYMALKNEIKVPFKVKIRLFWRWF